MKFSNLAQVCATLGSAVALATVVLMAEDKPRVRLFWEVVGGVFFGGGRTISRLGVSGAICFGSPCCCDCRLDWKIDDVLHSSSFIL